MTKAHHLKTRKPGSVTKALPLNFLLGCSEGALAEFELARLAEVADLRKELHATMGRVIDAMSQAALASWFKTQDRNSLKHGIENEESPEEWAHRMIRDGQRGGITSAAIIAARRRAPCRSEAIPGKKSRRRQMPCLPKTTGA